MDDEIVPVKLIKVCVNLARHLHYKEIHAYSHFERDILIT